VIIVTAGLAVSLKVAVMDTVLNGKKTV
jgi:hypothetical protein